MPTKQTVSQQLRDIKPPVEIHDMSFYLYWGAVILGIVILAAAVFYLIKLLLGLRRTNRRKAWLTTLKQIDWSDPKHGAYEATRLGRLLLGEERRPRELYRQMIEALEPYKYRKEVSGLTPEARAQFDLFVKACDESL